MDIKELRKHLGLTQDNFARKIGVSSMTIKRWESKKHQPSQLALRQLERLEKSKGN